MMTVAMKPCPFCGGGAHIKEVVSGCEVLYTVGCSDGECMGYETLLCKSTPEEAIAAWNRRAERTCRPVVASDGCGAWGVYCSECGHTLSGPHASRERAKRYAARRDIMLQYCPFCGARIEVAAP